MQTAKVLSTAEVKKIIAAHFGVDEKNVMPIVARQHHETQQL